MSAAADFLAGQRGVGAPKLVDRTSAGHPIYCVSGTSNPRSDPAFVTWSARIGRVIQRNTLKKAKAKAGDTSGTAVDAAPAAALSQRDPNDQVRTILLWNNCPSHRTPVMFCNSNLRQS